MTYEKVIFSYWFASLELMEVPSLWVMVQSSVGVNSTRSFSDNDLTILDLMSTLCLCVETAFPDEKRPIWDKVDLAFSYACPLPVRHESYSSHLGVWFLFNSSTRQWWSYSRSLLALVIWPLWVWPGMSALPPKPRVSSLTFPEETVPLPQAYGSCCNSVFQMEEIDT